MRLKGVLDFSLGNFLCLRGFAPMGDLYDISEPDPSIQRDLLRDHRDEMVAFLSQGEFLFFPEIILCTTLCHDGDENEIIKHLFNKIDTGQSVNLKFEDYRISSSTRRSMSEGDIRTYKYFRTATIVLNDKLRYKFHRIDGNHRLSAIPEDSKFRRHNTPFCLVIFRNTNEADRLSRALFHNINYKQIPLTMEQNLKLILDDDRDLFPDEKLKTHASFGWPYYLARQLNNKLDFDLLPNLKPFIDKEPRTFLVRQFTFLTERKVLSDNENAIKRFKAALSKTNSIFEEHCKLSDSQNAGLLAALVYYQLKAPQSVASFVKWVLENHLHLIKDTGAADLIKIFDKVLESRKRTVFVSMPFGKEATENHYRIIERICKEISDRHKLKPELKVERVDWFADGTSYEITDKIIEMISDCGLLIGDLTCCNPNVYHEIGFVMGKAKAEGKDATNMLLFLDESVAEERDKFVGFNLKGFKRLHFMQTEKFAEDLRENVERFFKLKI